MTELGQPSNAQTSDTPRPRKSSTLDCTEKRRGYYELADRMSLAENELAIFRNFKWLNILSLLVLQSEIGLLEQDLERIRKQDDQNNEKLDIFANSVHRGRFFVEHDSYRRNELSSSVTAMLAAWKDKKINCEQYDTLENIRKKLVQYNDLLLQFSKVNRLDAPGDIELLSFKYWTSTRQLNDTKSREFPLIIPSEEYSVLLPDQPDEYVSLQKPFPEKNIFSHSLLSIVAWLYKLLGLGDRDFTAITRPLFFSRVGPAKGSKSKTDDKTAVPKNSDGAGCRDLEEGQMEFRKSNLIVIADWLAPVLASVLLISTTLILYAVEGGTRRKLLIMMPITIGFSLVIKAITSATRSDTFAIIAGFVAVELVFIGNIPAPN